MSLQSAVLGHEARLLNVLTRADALEPAAEASDGIPRRPGWRRARRSREAHFVRHVPAAPSTLAQPRLAGERAHSVLPPDTQETGWNEQNWPWLGRERAAAGGS